jgi:hypothetical protein
MISSFWRAPVPGVILLPANTSVTNTPGSVVDRWVPVSWAWYWKTKEFVLGRSKTVLIETGFVSGARPLALTAEKTSLPPPVMSITNLQIYFVHTNESAKLFKYGSDSSWFRVSVNQGMCAKMVSAGGRRGRPSFSVGVLAKRRGDCTDLTTSIEATGFGSSLSTAITNLAMAARLQIPKGHALFILKSGEDPEEPEQFGMILTPTWK